MSLGNNHHGIGTIVLVVLVVLAGCAAGGGNGGGGARDAGNGGGGDGGGAAPGVNGAGSNAASTAESFYLGEERIVVREATMAVEVETFDPAFDRARSLVRESGGFVADWSVDVERGWHRATLQIKVPARNFSDVRDGLAALGTVESEHVRAKDFTDQYTDVQARLADLRQRERELVRLLDRTESPSRAYRIEQDLTDVRSELRNLEGEQASLERRHALSAIALTLREPAGNRAPRTYDAAAGFGPTFFTAFYAGLAVVKYAVAVLGFAAPIAALAVSGGIGGLVGVRLSRRLWSGLDATLARLGLTPSNEDEAAPSADPGDDRDGP